MRCATVVILLMGILQGNVQAFVRQAARLTRSSAYFQRRAQRSVLSANTLTCLELQSAAVNIPHPAKVEKGGEDAYFVLGSDVGVFDGVGGWAMVAEGDAALYSRMFANITAETIGAQRAAGIQQVDIAAALHAALKGTKAIGSTTACVASLLPSASAIVGLNLGDSGLLLLRKAKGPGKKDAPLEIVFRTKMQTHDFNTPYQLGTNCTDRPEDGELFSCRVEEGDVVILATDGLFDNLFDKDIVRIAQKCYESTVNVMALALAEEAFRFSGDKERISPWQTQRTALNSEKRGTLHRFVWRKKEIEMQKLFGLDERGRPVKGLGGKRDDITCVVARVV